MWFKRRKSTEQDHALSESLKSLQSLLSETGRREPNLDPADEPDVIAQSAPDPRDAPALKPRPSRRPASTGDDARSHEPPASDAASNRWRDLSLSFDAEPVLPKTRRDRDAAAEHPDTTPPPISESAEPVEAARQPEADADADAPAALSDRGAEDTAAEAENRDAENQEPEDGPGGPVAPEPPAAVQTRAPAGSEPTEPDIVTYGATEESPLPTPGSDALIHGPPPPDPAADKMESADADAASDYGFRSREDEEVLVLDLDAPGTMESGTTATEPSDSGGPVPADDAGSREPDPGDEPDSPAHDEVALNGAPPDDAPAGGPPDMESDAAEESHGSTTTLPGIDTPVPDETDESIPGEEAEEDQLHLELEATGDSEADIPVLTNAVYVPGAPPEPPPPPVDSPHAARIGHCIDNLRARLRLMELDALSAEQEQALHDTLAELLEDLERE